MNKIKSMLEVAEDTMERDITRIQSFGRGKKLSPGYARDIREYVKILALLVKMGDEESAKKKEDVSKLTDDELRQKAQELLGE